VKTTEFNDLCHREHEQDGGCVVRLYLTAESLVELTGEVLADPVKFDTPDGPLADMTMVGAKLAGMVNPATHTPVDIGLAVTRALFADTAEVTRWVPAAAGR
jgi:hypothetical protein